MVVGVGAVVVTTMVVVVWVAVVGVGAGVVGVLVTVVCAGAIADGAAVVGDPAVVAGRCVVGTDLAVLDEQPARIMIVAATSVPL